MSPKPSSNSTPVTKKLLVCACTVTTLLCVLLVVTAARTVSAPYTALSSTLLPSSILPTPNFNLPKVVESNKIIISFTGDIMLGRQVEEFINRFGTSYPTRYLENYFASSTAVVVNFESAMAIPHQKTRNGGMRFSVASTSLGVLANLGVTHASLANNHSLDYGAEGYKSTKNALTEKSITAFGHSINLASTSITYIPRGSSSVAIIGISTLYRTPTQSDITNVFTDAVANSSFQIVYIHWGNEYELVHSQAQEAFAKKLVSAGADVIIGHHPHVTQDIALIEGVPVLYSLGNFIFDQYFSTAVQSGYVVDLLLTATSSTLYLRPHTRADRAQPRAMTEEEANLFWAAVAQRSDGRHSEQIKAGIIAF